MKVISAFGPRTNKILVAARYAGVEVQHEDFFPRGIPEDQLKEFKEKNPNAQVPLLETVEGCIYESNAILRYIARFSKGATKWEEAQVDQYLNWASTLLEPTLYSFTGFFFGRSQHNERALTQARERLFGVLRVLEARLAQSRFLVGAEITIADIQVASDLLGVLRYFADEAFRGQFPMLSSSSKLLVTKLTSRKPTAESLKPRLSSPNFTGQLPVAEAKTEIKKAAPQPNKEKEEEDGPKEKNLLLSTSSTSRPSSPTVPTRRKPSRSSGNNSMIKGMLKAKVELLS